MAATKRSPAPELIRGLEQLRDRVKETGSLQEMRDIKGDVVKVGCRVVVMGEKRMDEIAGQVGYVHKIKPHFRKKGVLHALVYDVKPLTPPADEPPEDLVWGAWCEPNELSVV